MLAPFSPEFATRTEVNTEYEVHIVVRTTGGNLISNRVVCKTHSMQDLTGIRVSFGEFAEPYDVPPLKDQIQSIRASWTEELTPENTHLICTLARGEHYQRAAAMNIPVVTPEWLKQCVEKGKVQGVGAYGVTAEQAQQ